MRRFMKNLMLILVAALSLSVKAQVNVHPQIFNMGNSIQVQIFNSTNDHLYCSGPVYMSTMLGHFETSFYNDYVRKGSFSTRYFYLINFNDRVIYSSHGILCQKTK